MEHQFDKLAWLLVLIFVELLLQFVHEVCLNSFILKLKDRLDSDVIPLTLMRWHGAEKTTTSSGATTKRAQEEVGEEAILQSDL